MVYLELERMPKSCGECGLCMQVNNICAYCMATGYQIKYTELDMRDGMCPLRDSEQEVRNELDGVHDGKVWH